MALQYKLDLPDNVSFPITQEMIDNLPKGTKIHSPIAVTHPWVKVKPSEIPFTPYTTDDREFWLMTLQTVRGVVESRNRKFSDKSLMGGATQVSETLKKYYGIRRPDQLAKLVLADMPPEIPTKLAEYLIKKGVKFRNITNEGNYFNFTNGVVLLCRILAWSIHYVSPSAFASKWYYGVPRCAEVIKAWLDGEITAPADIHDELLRIIPKKWRNDIRRDVDNFTLFYKATPRHPSGGAAMHAAASAVTLILPVSLDVKEADREEITNTILNIAFGRNYLGVHSLQDDYYGLEIGERVIEKILPTKLAKFGANKKEVEELIKKYRTDWISKIDEEINKIKV